MDDKDEKCIFLGASEQSKAYKLYNLITKKIVISRDIIFDEENNGARDEISSVQSILADFDGDNHDSKQLDIEEKHLTPNTVVAVPQNAPTAKITYEQAYDTNNI